MEILLNSLFAAMLTISLFLCLGSVGILAAAVALGVHELGHVIAIKIMGLHLRGLKRELSGLRIDYTGLRTPLMDTFAAAAGPLLGLIYSFLIALFSDGSAGSFWGLSRDLSLFYSAFNLLPVIPLDGGRILFCVINCRESADAEQIVSALSRVFCFCLVIAGLVLQLKGEGSGMLAAGLWALLLQSGN